VSGAPLRTGERPRPPGAVGVDRRSRLASSSAAIAVGTGLSRITGVMRLAALAYALGTTRFSDTYNLANTTPNVIYELILGGVLTATLVPVFVAHLDENDHDAVSAVTTVAGIVLAVFSAVGVLAAPLLVHLFTGAPDKAATATTLLRWFMPQVFFYGATAVLTAILNARRSFAAPAFTPVLNNLLVTIVLVALPHLSSVDPADFPAASHDQAYLTILGLATTLGVVVMAVALLPSLRHVHVRLRFLPAWRHPAVRKVVRLSGWTVGYVMANQIALVVALRLADGEGNGRQAAYLLAYTFFQLPHGLIAVTVMTTHGPALARSAAQQQWPHYRRDFTHGLRTIVVLVAPAAAGLVALAKPTVSVVLERGLFDAASTDITGRLLAFYSVGLVAFSVYLFALRGFYAVQDARTPFVLNAVENGINIVLALILVPLMGIDGLALAFSIAYLIAAFLSVARVSRQVTPVMTAVTGGILIRATFAAVLMGELVYLAVTRFGSDHGGGALARIVIGVPLGVAIYAVLLAATRPSTPSRSRSGRAPGAVRLPGAPARRWR
jgi:putative peptidoglycan lipid II flippase